MVVVSNYSYECVKTSFAVVITTIQILHIAVEVDVMGNRGL